MVLPANVQGRPQGQGLQQGHHQAGGRGWKEDFGSRQKKEPPLDLSGPRARLYMPVDKVVAACGKGGDAFEGNTKPTGRRSNLEDGPARTERGPVCKGHPQQEVRNRSPPFNMTTLSPPHAPLGQFPRLQGANIGPRLPGGTHYQPNRPPRFQPRFPTEKKTRKPLATLVSSEKDNFKIATNSYSTHRPPPTFKPVNSETLLKMKPEVFQAEVAPESFDLLDQLESAVAESLGAGKEMVAKTVADSWRNQVCNEHGTHIRIENSWREFSIIGKKT